MREALRSPLPKEAIKQHPTKTYLSSIKGIYQIERLNDVFGVGAWHQKSTVVSASPDGMIVVYSQLFIPEYGVELESFGGNDNGGEKSKGFDLGDAYKGACTDALSKMCSFLEIAIDVYKGNPNSTPPTASAQAVKPKAPVKSLIPGATDGSWNKVIDGMKGNGRMATDWPKIKENYLITPAHEKQLFSEMGWEYKS